MEVRKLIFDMPLLDPNPPHRTRRFAATGSPVFSILVLVLAPLAADCSGSVASVAAGSAGPGMQGQPCVNGDLCDYGLVCSNGVCIVGAASAGSGGSSNPAGRNERSWRFDDGNGWRRWGRWRGRHGDRRRHRNGRPR